MGASADEGVVGNLSALAGRGYTVLPGLLEPTVADSLRDELDQMLESHAGLSAREGDGEFAGPATRRVYDPLARTRVLDCLVLHPRVNEVLDQALGEQRQLGMTIVSRIDDVQPAQMLHYDAGIYPLRGSGRAVEVNVIWAIDDFSIGNGGTVVIPGSHRWPLGRRPTAEDGPTAVDMPAGSALIYAGNLWHGSGENSSGERRLGVIFEHVLAWLRPAENHTLAVPRHVIEGLDPHLQALLGYNQPSKYLGFVAGQHPQHWLQKQSS